MVGYLYCHEWEEVNRKIAHSEISSKEFTREVRKHPSILPTTALSAQRIMDDYGISNDRAQVKILHSSQLVYIHILPFQPLIDLSIGDRSVSQEAPNEW